MRLLGPRAARRQEAQQQRAENAGFAGDVDQEPGVQQRVSVITMDQSVQGSQCVGFDCTSSESYGFDTLRLKENNLRIHFDDTSSSASFPNNDWRLVANDSSNGGANYFAINDATAGRDVFKIEAGSIVNALYVDDEGDVGIGTSTPVVEVHAVDGNTPTFRLEQNGSSGFSSQTWDLAGNETNFFIRDVTNSSKLPFRIKPGAPTDTLFLKGDGDIGIGTDSPTQPLHVRRTNDTAQVLIEDTGSGSRSSNETLLYLLSNGPPLLKMEDTNGGGEWDLIVTGDNSFQIDNPNETGTQLLIEEDGTVTASGTVSGSSDRNVKKYITDISAAEILAKVAKLPIHEWTYIADDDGARHVGPMAQDFMAAFGLGKSDKHIAFSDSSGVALAAIKGLHEMVEKKDAELAELRSKTAELDALRAKTSELEAQMKMLIEKVGAGQGAD